MRVRDLRRALDEVRTIFNSAGAKPQEKAFDQISAALSSFDDLPVEAFFSDVRASAENTMAPASQRYAQRLANAELNEVSFLAVLSDIQTDKKLKKADLQKIAKAYTGTFDKKATGPKIIDSIKLAFYTKLYEQNSRDMARRATPV